MSHPLVSLVTACDRNFLWGAYLLAASAARNIPHVPLCVLQTGFTEDDRAQLEQFPGIRVLAMAEGNRRNVCNRKAEAILLGDGEYVGWLDADCMIIGDVAAGLIPENAEFQIRMRDGEENAWVWRHHYALGEARGGLPESVLDRWRADVGDLDVARVDSACVTNAFVLHRRHFDFIQQWQEQIARVIPPSDGGVVNKSSPAYFMTDESVLTSLLAFSRLAPPIGEWRLVGSSRVDLQACKLEYSIVSPK